MNLGISVINDRLGPGQKDKKARILTAAGLRAVPSLFLPTQWGRIPNQAGQLRTVRVLRKAAIATCDAAPAPTETFGGDAGPTTANNDHIVEKNREDEMRKLTTTFAVLAAALLMAPGAASAQTKLTLGMPTTPPNIVHMPALVAIDLGIYKKYGLEVEVLALEGGVKTFRALVSGNVDIAMAILSNLPKFEASMVVGKNVKDMADLKGKRIGIQQPGGFADILSKNVLRHAKISPKDVNFVSIATEDVPALVADQVDTAILHIEQEMLAKSKVPGLHAVARMWELAPKQIYNVMAVTEKTIADKPDALKAFVKANIEATRALYTQKDKIIPILVERTGYPKDIVEQSYDFMVKECMWDANTGLGKDRIDFTANLMTKVGNIPKGKTPSYEDVVDASFAEAAIKELGEWKGDVCKTPVM
jgi:NitT/TauT family transport system substrate-binding protein